MGAWAVDAFGNDDACDWAASLIEADDLSMVRSTMAGVLASGSDYLESPDAAEGLAAAEVVARLQGHFGERNTYTEEVDAWVAKQQQSVDHQLATMARDVIDRVLTAPSELLELWQESDDFDAWKANLSGLKARIVV